MRRLLGAATASAAVVFGALLGRRQAEHKAATRSAGSLVELPTLQAVLDAGDRIWRGPAPDAAGYRELAAAGCSLVVDLRSGDEVGDAAAQARAAGLARLTLTIDNGRPPASAHLLDFADAHNAHDGVTYVHCEAGEGRTGAIIGAFAVRRGQPAREAMADALSVGSLTFAQLLYIASAGTMGGAVVAVDWLIDRPTEALFDLARARDV